MVGTTKRSSYILLYNRQYYPQFFSNVYDIYLFGRSDFQCSPAFQVVILASEVANHPVAECTCHSHGECICRACKAKCKAGFLVRTIVITFTFSG